MAKRKETKRSKSQPLPKRGRGAPPKLTPELIDGFAEVLEQTSTPVQIMADAAGVARGTWHRWMSDGERDSHAGTDSIYRDLYDTVTSARARGTMEALRLVRALAKKKSDSAGIRWELERTQSKHFGLRVKVYVEEELRAAYIRLRERFKNRPDVWEEIAQVLAQESDDGAGDDGGSGGGSGGAAAAGGQAAGAEPGGGRGEPGEAGGVHGAAEADPGRSDRPAPGELPPVVQPPGA